MESNALKLFRSAYENRYTWEKSFTGYQGDFTFVSAKSTSKGKFKIDSTLKPTLEECKDEETRKIVYSQLWEVAIHRIRRSFDSVHGGNNFIEGDSNEIGTEIIVGGKNKGDIYRVKDNIVTMVYRHIHGNLINIFTHQVLNTDKGYLTTNYTSQYLHPISKTPIKNKLIFEDEFIPLFDEGPYVLKSRKIMQKINNKEEIGSERFIFSNLELNDKS